MTKKELAEELYKHFNDERTFSLDAEKYGFYSPNRCFEDVAYELLHEEPDSDIFPYVCVALASKAYPKKDIFDKERLYNQAYDALVELKNKGTEIDLTFFEEVKTQKEKYNAEVKFYQENDQTVFFPNSANLIKGAEKITKRLHFHDAIIQDIKFDINEEANHTDVTIELDLYCDYEKIRIKFCRLSNIEFYVNDWWSTVYLFWGIFQVKNDMLVFDGEYFAKIECEHAEILLLE